MLGLRRNEVKMIDHSPEWDEIANQMIQQLWKIFGSTAEDIQHFGSTAIRHIKAKPDMLIAVGVKNMDTVDETLLRLQEIGISKIENQSEPNTVLCALAAEIDSGVHSLYVHILPYGSKTWNENSNFKDYLNAFPQKAAEYESMKISLAKQYPNDRKAYKNGKIAFFKKTFTEAHAYNQMKQELDISAFEPINKGLSGDSKYRVETADNKQLLLRLSDISQHDQKKAAYDRMKHMAAHKIPMPSPVSFGVASDGNNIYQLLNWCEGENLETILPTLTESEQYTAGLKAGEILHKIHQVPVTPTDATTANWNERYSSFIDQSIKSFQNSKVPVENSELILNYFENNRHLLETRPQCYIHGDYHAGNMMLSATKEISIIDWEIHLFNSYGDPWKELTMQATPHFSTGLIQGYFSGQPPEDFWPILALYTSISAISAIPWAYYSFPSELESCINHCANVLEWFDNMKNPVPTWYTK